MSYEKAPRTFNVGLFTLGCVMAVPLFYVIRLAMNEYSSGDEDAAFAAGVMAFGIGIFCVNFFVKAFWSKKQSGSVEQR